MKNPFGGIFDTTKKQSAQETADKLSRLQNIEMTQNIGMDESGRYLSGTLAAPQSAYLKSFDKQAKSDAADYEKKAGISKEQSQAQLAKITLDKEIMKASMMENTWEKAIKSLGYSTKEAATFLAELRDEDNKARQAQNQLMMTVAKIGITAGASAFGGPAGGIAAGAVMSGVGSTGESAGTVEGGVSGDTGFINMPE